MSKNKQEPQSINTIRPTEAIAQHAMNTQSHLQSLEMRLENVRDHLVGPMPTSPSTESGKDVVGGVLEHISETLTRNAEVLDRIDHIVAQLESL